MSLGLAAGGPVGRFENSLAFACRSRSRGVGSREMVRAEVQPDNLRYTKIPLNIGSGAIPALGFGTLIPDPVATKTATKAALEAGFRQLDASERYRNEKEVGDALQEVF